MLPPSRQDPTPAVPPRTVDFDIGFRLSMIVDPDGLVRHVAESHGIDAPPAEAFVGRTVMDLSARHGGGEERAALWSARLASAREATESVHYADAPPGSPPGTPTTVEATVTPVRAATGELQAIHVVIDDRTAGLEARRVLEERAAEARAQESQLRAALAMTGLGRFELTLGDDVALSGDARFWQIMGLEAEPFVPLPGAVERYFEMLHREDVGWVQAAFEAAVAGGPDYEVEYRFDRPTDDGAEERWVAVIGRVEFGEAGPIRLVGAMEDVTDRRRGEEIRLLAQKREVIGTLAGGIAHDFNNVISAILSNATVARREVESGASPLTSITEIARGAVRAADLTRQMLAYSREDEPSRGDLDLGEIAREACSLVRPTLPPGIELRLDTAPALPPVRGDAAQLHQLVMNLVTNAGQAIDGTGTVEVAVGPVEPVGSEPTCGVEVVVRDTGRGMSDAVRGRAFDPFFTARPAGGGTGLGLPAALTIARSHDGTITIESEVGVGTTVRCVLPTSAAPPEPDAAGPVDEPDVAEPPEARRPRVLFV
ncbi:MAG: ATP-binding protein, partial [Solirubrobacteraceae bacterium]